MKVQLDITSEQLQQLRDALSLSPLEIEAIAAACVERLKAESLAQAASLTVAEFAKQARITVTHAHKLVRQGRLEATNPSGGERRITAAAAAKYFAGGSNGNA